MSLSGNRTYVGFGLGAIQTGLFLYEALASGNFGNLVVAEVVPEVVHLVRGNRGFLTVNIAHVDHIEAVSIGPVEILDPMVDIERKKLIGAVAAAHEIGTAVPATRFYTSPGQESLCRILATGLQVKMMHAGPRAVLYAAENHNHAAEILEELVLAEIPSAGTEIVRSQVRFLNTVIGKMSGVVRGKSEIERLSLEPMTPDSDRAFLVESFNRILISKINFPNDAHRPAYERGITTFVEKDNLLPFEEAKLFGHNATHALGAYLGGVLGIERIAEIPSIPGLLGFLRRAFIEESGLALVHRYNGIDPLFTIQGYTAYADDLLRRMVNPWLTDTAERVGRDVERKLGWDDRLIGTIRLGLSEGIMPYRFSFGVAAALLRLDPGLLTNTSDPREHLLDLWGAGARDPGQEHIVLTLISEAMNQLRSWHANNLGDPKALLGEL